MQGYYTSEDHRNYHTGTYRPYWDHRESNPTYAPRKASVNQELAEVSDLAPTARVVLHWFGAARRVLSTPLVGEEELFAEAAMELARLRKEVRV